MTGSYSTSLILGSFFSIPSASARAVLRLATTHMSVHLMKRSRFPSGLAAEVAHRARCLRWPQEQVTSWPSRGVSFNRGPPKPGRRLTISFGQGWCSSTGHVEGKWQFSAQGCPHRRRGLRHTWSQPSQPSSAAWQVLRQRWKAQRRSLSIKSSFSLETQVNMGGGSLSARRSARDALRVLGAADVADALLAARARLFHEERTWRATRFFVAGVRHLRVAAGRLADARVPAVDDGVARDRREKHSGAGGRGSVSELPCKGQSEMMRTRSGRQVCEGGGGGGGGEQSASHSGAQL
mgnify:CR=1 FL=1